MFASCLIPPTCLPMTLCKPLMTSVHQTSPPCMLASRPRMSCSAEFHLQSQPPFVHYLHFFADNNWITLAGWFPPNTTENDPNSKGKYNILEKGFFSLNSSKCHLKVKSTFSVMNMLQLFSLFHPLPSVKWSNQSKNMAWLYSRDKVLQLRFLVFARDAHTAWYQMT